LKGKNMKYFIGRVAILDQESKREYSSDACFAAKSEDAARRLLDSHAKEWDADGQPIGGGHLFETDGYLFDADDRPYAVFPHSLTEISAVTFSEMSSILSSYQDGDVGDLSKEPADERVRTLALRIGAQLTKRSVPVPHSKLLHAISASVGETDWQVLSHKAPPALKSEESSGIPGLQEGGHGAVCGAYIVEVEQLETGDEFLWGDLRAFENVDLTDEERVETATSALTACPASASADERNEFCRRVAEMLNRAAPDPARVDARSLENAFISAVQGDQSDEAILRIEEALRASVR
jgi:hypothetical protein